MLTDTDVVFTEQEINRLIKQIEDCCGFAFICILSDDNCETQVEHLLDFGLESGFLDPSKAQGAFEFLGEYEGQIPYNQRKIELLKLYKQHIYGE